MASSKEPAKFFKDKPYVILCEGVDEFYFLIWYLEFLNKNYKEQYSDCFHVVDLGGVDDMKNIFNSIQKIPNYNYVKGLLFVRDAEKSATSATKSLIDNIKRVWDVSLDSSGCYKVSSSNVKLGFYLFPGKDSRGEFCNGTLEDLLVEIFNISSDEELSLPVVKKMVKAFLKEIEQNRTKKMSTPHKNCLHLMLSCTDKYVGMKIGEVAKANGFDFNSPKLDDLKDMIIALQS